MNSLFIFIPAVILLLCGYKFYGRFISRLFDVSACNPTPAEEKPDGIDYVPAIFMLVVTISALLLSIADFIAKGQFGLVMISLLLLALGIFVTIEAVIAALRRFRIKKLS